MMPYPSSCIFLKEIHLQKKKKKKKNNNKGFQSSMPATYSARIWQVDFK
jgi:hypothetical protein